MDGTEVIFEITRIDGQTDCSPLSGSIKEHAMQVMVMKRIRDRVGVLDVHRDKVGPRAAWSIKDPSFGQSQRPGGAEGSLTLEPGGYGPGHRPLP